MKKNDILTTIGLVLGALMVVFGIISGGGVAGFASFIDIPSMFIVFGGLVAAILTSYPMGDLKKVVPMTKQAFSQTDQDLQELIKTFVTLSDKARREGLLALEAEIENVEDTFIKKGILLAVDGIEPDVIADIMTAEISAMEERHKSARGIFEKGGEYAPAWGMIGTLIGLVLMLKSLSDPSTLGPKMAIALLTTLYGSLIANLIFIPLAAKLQLKTEKEIFTKQIIIEGVIGVQSGQNPKILEEKLSAFVAKQKAKDGEEQEAEGGGEE